MLSPPAHPPAIPAYKDYRAPTEEDARAALRRVFGDGRGEERWAYACREAGFAPGGVEDAGALALVLAALSARGGPGSAVARSIEIRMRTHTRLAARSASPSTKGGQG